MSQWWLKYSRTEPVLQFWSINFNSGLLICWQLYAYLWVSADQQSYIMVYGLEGEGLGAGWENFTSALCAGPHLLYAEQQVLVTLLRLRCSGGVAALHLHRTTCSMKWGEVTKCLKNRFVSPSKELLFSNLTHSKGCPLPTRLHLYLSSGHLVSSL